MSTYSNDITTGGTTTRSDDPEVIRRDIESTRADLSRNVDALTEKVSPSRVVGRRVDRAKDAVGSVKDKVMGSSDNPYDQGAMGDATDKASSMASSIGDTATSAPTIARQKTRGNPLAAGMIAFGVGWLASSLLPATEKEQEAASAVKDKASEHSDTLTAPIKEAAGNAKENLRAPAQDALQSVKGTATEATATVKDEAAAAKDDVTGNGSTSY
jgi:uncharacterized protein YjbJ (UPF0337 family)